MKIAAGPFKRQTQAHLVDCDHFNHVNNASFLWMAEEARVRARLCVCVHAVCGAYSSEVLANPEKSWTRSGGATSVNVEAPPAPSRICKRQLRGILLAVVCVPTAPCILLGSCMLAGVMQLCAMLVDMHWQGLLLGAEWPSLSS